MNLVVFIIFLSLYTFNVSCATFETNWGICNLQNYGGSVSEFELIEIINSKVDKMNLIYGPIPKKSFSITIVNDNTNLIQHKNWKWSLGITYHNPDRIIIKDPAFSKISKKKFTKVIEHELNHVMLNRFNNHHTIPRWFKEGFAMMTADEIDSVTKESLKLELTTLTNVGLRLGQLRKWLDVVDKDEETEQLEHTRMVE